jgi:formate dehydrogenase beta subunit
MHCTTAACVTVCPSGALYYNKEFGTVGMDREKCIGCKECVSACPFEVPKYDKKTEKVSKCDMCESRITNKLPPACVKACPTAALKWVDKDEAMKIAEGRVQYLGGDAHIYGDKFVGGTHMMYVLKEKTDIYEGIHKDPKVPQSIALWKNLLKPLSLLAAGGVVGGSLLHYFTHGPHKPHPEHYDQDEKKQGGV